MQNEVFWRWLKTVQVLLVVMNAGMPMGLFGTTFPDMAILMSVTNGQMATTMTWIGLFSIVGTLCMGPLFDRFDGLLLLSCCLLLQGLAVGVAPWCPILVVFQVMAGISCLFGTGIMTGSLCVNSIIWKKKSKMLNPIIQLTILTFALGSAITPQLVAPFIGAHQLPDIMSPTATPNGSNVSCFFENADFDSVTSDSTTTNSSVRYEGPEPVQIAYSLVACIGLLTAVVSFVIWALDRSQRRTKSCDDRVNSIIRKRSYSLNADGRTIEDEEFSEESPRSRTGSLDRLVLQKKFEEDLTKRGDQAKPDIRKLLLKRQGMQETTEFRTRNDKNAVEAATDNPHGNAVIDNSVPPVTCSRKITPLVTIVILFFVLSGCTDAIYGGLLYTFINGYLHWTPQDGTLLVTVYQVTRLVMHAVVVVIARFISPVALIVMDIIFLVVSSILILITINASPIFMWIAVILAAFATSNLHPSSLTNAQRCFQLNGKMIGMLFGSVFIGLSAVSPIVGLLLDSYGAISFPVVLLSITGLEIVLLALWLVVARAVRRSHDETSVEDIVIQNESTPLIGR